VIGHQLAWESGALDRDTSFGNLLLSDEPGLKGFLLDYSAAIPLPGNPSYRSSTLSEMTVRHFSDFLGKGTEFLVPPGNF
jgi:hypothetical protein